MAARQGVQQASAESSWILLPQMAWRRVERDLPMVSVNGSMVPPYGLLSKLLYDPGGVIEFGSVKDGNGKPISANVPNRPGGPRRQMGDGSPGFADSVDAVVTPSSGPKTPCTVSIYVHLSLSGSGCTQKQVDAAIESLELGAKALSGKCPCQLPAPAGMELKEPGYVDVRVILVWYPKANPPGVIEVPLKCGKEYPSASVGEADSEAGTIEFDGDLSNRFGSLSGHEIGHIIFGTGNQKPADWTDNSHNPDPNSFMRDYEDRKGKGPMGRGEVITEQELCILVRKAKPPEGCCYGPMSRAVTPDVVLKPDVQFPL